MGTIQLKHKYSTYTLIIIIAIATLFIVEATLFEDGPWVYNGPGQYVAFDILYFNITEYNSYINYNTPTLYINSEDSITFTKSNTSEYQNITTQNIKTNGSITVEGNITGNLIYAELWNTSLGTFTIAQAGVYYPITGLIPNGHNGFGWDGMNLTVEVAGVYHFVNTWTFSGTANNEYHLSIHHNGTKQDNCHAEQRTSNTNDIGSASMSCILTLAEGDTIVPCIENAGAANDAVIHDINLNIIRIGNG